MEPYPPVLLHPETAMESGIAEGNWVWIETKHGKARFKAKVTKSGKNKTNYQI